MVGPEAHATLDPCTPAEMAARLEAGGVTLPRLLRNWTLVYAGNALGAAATAKVALSFGQAFFKGVFCKALVCLAV